MNKRCHQRDDETCGDICGQCGLTVWTTTACQRGSTVVRPSAGSIPVAVNTLEPTNNDNEDDDSGNNDNEDDDNNDDSDGKILFQVMDRQCRGPVCGSAKMSMGQCSVFLVTGSGYLYSSVNYSSRLTGVRGATCFILVCLLNSLMSNTPSLSNSLGTDV